MIILIDNYDSFVYTLARYVKKLGVDCVVYRNDKITIKDIRSQKPEAIIISPGPCAPQQAGISIPLIKELGAEIPILGVCLGHQAIGEAYGGKTIRAAKPVHGKSSSIHHNESTLFDNIPNPFDGGRYHSLIVDLTEADGLHVIAKTESDDIMAIQHQEHPVFGIQFHPESILTPHGIDIIKNFITFAYHYNNNKTNQI